MPGYVECFVKCLAMLSYYTLVLKGHGQNGRKNEKGYVEFVNGEYM